MPDIRLLEREAHLDLLEVALAEARGGSGRLVWIEGPAGAGKTSLVTACRRRADETGMTTLRATGDEFESELPWGVVFQLFQRRVRQLDDDEQAAVFAGPAHHAAPLLLEGRDPSGADRADLVDADARLRAGTIHHGIQWLVANLADRTPLLVVVDDLQWADASSLEAIAYLARRVQDLPVVLLLSCRVGVTNASSKRRERLRREPYVHRLAPPALSPSAVAILVRAARPGATDPLCEAVHRATGGNAFLVDIAQRILVEHADDTDAELTTRLTAAGSDDLRHEVEVRLLALDPTTARVARAIAIIGAHASLPVVGPVAEVGDDELKTAVDDLLVGDWVEVDEPDPADGPGDRSVGFRHPLIRAAVVALVPDAEADAWHGRTADALEQQGRPAEEIVPHLLASRPRGRASSAQLLFDVAERSRRSGAASVAVALLRRAILEPPAPELVAPAHRALARSAAAANDPDVGGHFVRAVEVTPRAEDRARLHFQAGRALATRRRYHDAAVAIERAMAEDDGDDPGFTAELDAAHLVALRMDPQRRAEWRPRLDALARDSGGEGGAVAHALAAELAYDRGVRGVDFPTARRLALDAVACSAGTALGFANPMAWSTAMHALHQVNEFERAAVVAQDLVRAAQDVGSSATFVLASSYLALHTLRLGQLTRALAALGAIDPADAGMGVFVPLNAATMSQTYLALGRPDDARRALDLPGGPERWAQELTIGGVAEAGGWLCLAEGRPDRALALFEQVADGFDGVGRSHPSTTSWRSGAARASVQLGRRAAARELSDAELALAREWGAPRALGRALVTAGLVHTGAIGLGHLDDAVDTLQPGEAVLDLAEALVERADRRQELRNVSGARDDLRAALDLAHRHGADALAARAEAGLRAGGARPRARALTGVEALTPSELRVAQLAASGLRNNDIAAELFVSRKAVEYHLSNVYRKLHIDGRAALGQALAPDPAAGPGG